MFTKRPHPNETLRRFTVMTPLSCDEHESQSDIRLMKGFKNGEEACMEQLLHRYQGPLIQYVYRIVGNRAIAEELTQTVFLRLHRCRLTYQPTAKFSNWLYCIANHLALNWLRDHRHDSKVLSFSAGWERDRERERQIADTRPTAEHDLLMRARLQEVRQAIDELPDRQRNVIIMQRYKEMEYAQIAKALNCTPQTVKSLIFRAHNTLRTRLAS